MKNLNPQSFAFGLFFGLCVFALLSFINIKEEAVVQRGDGVIQLHETDAQVCRRNYKAIFPNKPLGFDISVGQWKAINQVVQDLNGKTENLSGFRMYHGLTEKKATSKKITTVYALSSQRSEPQRGSDNMNSMVTAADDVATEYTDPCPPFCD